MSHDPNYHLKPPSLETIGERLRNNLLRECLPDLEYLEGGSKTSAVRRNLIAQIKHLTKTKGN